MTLPKIALQNSKTHVADLLKETYVKMGYDSFGTAVAYATVSGVRKMIDSILQDNPPKQSYWLFGLDDWITQPGAIASALKVPGAKVRVAVGGELGGKFHPKLYWFSHKNKFSSLVIGSANLTQYGLEKSVEAIATIAASNVKDSKVIDDFWLNAWKLGKPVTKKFLEEYEKKYAWAKLARKKAGLDANHKLSRSKTGRNIKRVVLDNDSACIDPSLAKTCWIEVGKITGFGADQLEIKAEQALFFGLPSNGGADQNIRFQLKSGISVSIRAHYFGNHMWRFSLPQNIPEVANKGLRPGVKRSPYAAVFVRKGKTVSLRFVKISSPLFKKLRKETERLGTLGRTTAREYGWI